jgi:hypothetical protein
VRDNVLNNNCNFLMEWGGDGPHYLCTGKGHTGTLSGWNRHLYGIDIPVRCTGAFSLIAH